MEAGDGEEKKTHSFWLEGYAKNKEKKDRLIEHGGVKVIDYLALETTILKAVHECSTRTLTIGQMGALLRSS